MRNEPPAEADETKVRPTPRPVAPDAGPKGVPDSLMPGLGRGGKEERERVCVRA